MGHKIETSGLEPLLHRFKVYCLTNLATSHQLVSHAFISTAEILADSQTYRFYILELLLVARLLRTEWDLNPRTTFRPSSVFKTDTISHSVIRPKGGRPTGKRWDADVKNPTHLVGIDSQKRVKSNQHNYNNTESKLCQPLEDIFLLI